MGKLQHLLKKQTRSTKNKNKKQKRGWEWGGETQFSQAPQSQSKWFYCKQLDLPGEVHSLLPSSCSHHWGPPGEWVYAE